MPEEKIYYDQEGNEIKLPYSLEEVENIKTDLGNKEEELKRAKISLGKLENKDFNFRKLRDMTEKEQNKLSTKELEMMKWREKIENDIKVANKALRQSWKKEALTQLEQNIDKDRKEKVNYYYKQLIKGRTRSEDTVKQSIQDAYFLATKDTIAGGINPITQMTRTDGSYMGTGKSLEEELTPNQLEIGKRLGVSEEDFKKFGNRINTVVKPYSTREISELAARKK